MPALRQPVKRPAPWLIWIAAVALAAAAIFDWRRPAPQQFSVAAYNHVVVGGYRLLVRPVTSKFIHCRFYPTCSEYSVQAVRVHGLPEGLWLTVKRLVRCGPWTPIGTFDPVPPAHAR